MQHTLISDSQFSSIHFKAFFSNPTSNKYYKYTYAALHKAQLVPSYNYYNIMYGIKPIFIPIYVFVTAIC